MTVVVFVSVVVFGAGLPTLFNWLLASVKNVSTVGMTTRVSHGWVMPSWAEFAAMRPTANDPIESAMTTKVWYAISLLLPPIWDQG